MTQLTLRDVSKSYGADPLFRSITLAVGADERIGLIGANGSGKSTLLRILAGLVEPDAGDRTVQKGLRLGYLPQEDELDPELTVEETVAAPLHDAGLDPAELYTRVGVALGKAGFDDRKQPTSELSGGQRKRLALARELAKEPDILLLDEPTNHLDLETILWLENFLLSLSKGFVVVSHDRWFLEHVTSRTIELGRCYPEGYLSVDAPYSDFLERRIEFLESQACLEATLANKVRREVEWLRRGPKARTTKAKYRKDEAARLQEQLAETRKLNADPGPAGIDFTATERKTKRLLVARSIAKSMGDKTLFQDLDVVLAPGNRLGLVGLNGSGKTTLLRVLAGELAPDAGTVKCAPDLQLAVFDQNREQLDPDQPLRRALAPEGDTVQYRGRPLHVASWAKRFLFSPEQLPLPVGELSGGEQARIYIARLMVRPADVLMLDEPTNDLDIPTLEVLEDSLIDFPGAVVLITHDRFFLDRVATHVLGLDPEAGGAEKAAFYGDYAQWEQASKKAAKARDKTRAKAAAPKPQPKPKPKKVKLSYKEQREWDSMEDAIHQAEAHLEACQTALEDPAVASDAAKLTELSAAHEQAQETVDRLYERWEELERIQSSPGGA